MYGPFFYLYGSLLAWLAHGIPHLLLVLVRSVSFCAFLGSVTIIALLVWRRERHGSWTAVAVVLCLACPWGTSFAASARPDLVAIFLALAAFFLFTVAEEASGCWFFAACSAASQFLRKQTVAPVPRLRTRAVL